MIARPKTMLALAGLLAIGTAACAAGGTDGGGDGGASTVGVRVSPATVALTPSAQRTFLAAVTGTANLAVTWSVREGGAGGNVTSTGLYTAPSALGDYHVVATSVADPTKSGAAAVTVSTSPPDLCSGLVHDKVAHPMTAVTKPAKGQAFVDPQFGTTVRRISDASSAVGAAGVIAPMYSTVQAWNADESYLILYHTGGSGAGHHLYNGKTYAHIKQLDISPADIEQVFWDTSNPKILYYVDGTALKKFNVDTDANATATVLRDFATAPTSCGVPVGSGGDPMFTSWSSQFIGLHCGDKQFSYDLVNNTLGSVVTVAAGGDAVQASPSGALYFLDVSGASQVRDRNMALVRTLPVNGDEHASMGTSDGVDTLYTVQFDGAATGSMVAADLTTGAARTIIGESTGWPYPPHDTHLSALAYKNPGWVAAGIIGDVTGGVLGQGILENEIILVNTNSGGGFCRVAHARTCADVCGTIGYFGETHVVISPSGTRILFGSDWNGGATVDAYVVELPLYGR
jgi:hypothetical protein